MASLPDITFYSPRLLDVSSIENVDLDVDWKCFGSGISVWIIQTYLRVNKTGLPVKLSSEAPSDGIVIVHADDLHTYFSSPRFSNKCLIVCVRADRKPQIYADFEIVQNIESSIKCTRAIYMPHWPQPALLPRKESRGTNVLKIVFKGAGAECNTMFFSSEWSDFLAENGLQWVLDEAGWHGATIREYREVAWNDYSDADLVIAIRKNQTILYDNKPASKLINAWLAGVPAILGPEVAYRELRRSEFDYIEASTLNEVMVAVVKLKNDPNLYNKMVENGRKRGADYSADVLVKKWSQLIYNDLASFYNGFQWRVLCKLPVGFRWRFRMLLDRF